MSTTKPETDLPYDQKTRSCLKCQDEFVSSWVGERICPRCKNSQGWRTSGADFELKGMGR